MKRRSIHSLLIKKFFTAILLISLFHVNAQDYNPWEISVDPEIPSITEIKIDTLILPCLNDVQKIWNKASSGLPYNAFTSLVRFKGEWYCSFREADIHGYHRSGRARIIKSGNGLDWESIAVFDWDSADVRGNKLSITPEGWLMMNSRIGFIPLKKVYDNTIRKQSVTWFSKDGQNWSNAATCESGLNMNRWSVTWHEGIGYSFASDKGGVLYRSCDGKYWEELGSDIFQCNGSETSIVFGNDGKAYCLLRDDGSKEKPYNRCAKLGVAENPYINWLWSEIGPYIGGPHMIKLHDGRLLAGVRMHRRTVLCWVDPEQRIMREFLVLPSGGLGGSGYCGLVEYDGMIWVSYYSGHNDQGHDTSIYLAKVKLLDNSTRKHIN